MKTTAAARPIAASRATRGQRPPLAQRVPRDHDGGHDEEEPVLLAHERGQAARRAQQGRLSEREAAAAASAG